MKLKGKLALLMSIVLAFTCVFSGLHAIASPPELPEESEVLFKSGFESGDTAPITNTAIDGKLKNVGSAGYIPTLDTDITDKVILSSIAGSKDMYDHETKAKLFDKQLNESKWLSDQGVPSVAAPVWVSFQINEASVIDAYTMTSANDSAERDPATWDFYGSVDGTVWVKLDSRSNIRFENRFEVKLFTFSNTTAYTYFKMDVTKNAGNNNLTQIAELAIGTYVHIPPIGGDDSSPLTTVVNSGPLGVWCNTPNVGWTGARALNVSGKTLEDGEAYCSNVLYENVNIPVTEHTNLSYMIFPSTYVENTNLDNDVYDFQFLNMSFMVDLAFTDGTYLSDLNAKDYYGVDMTPVGQALGKCLYSMQWNNVLCNIGSYANGKTIDKIIINFGTEDTDSASFRAFFDDIIIENKAPRVYENLSEYVNILRGSNSTDKFSRGLTAPLVTVPHGFNFYMPVTNSNSNAPYFYQISASKNTLRHFSTSHIPSNWVGDWGTWQWMANTSVNYSTATSASINADNRAATFSHDKEIANAHYYAITLEEGSKASGVKMEMTPTDHAVYTRYTFPANAANRNVIFDCERADGSLKYNSDGSFEGYSDHRSNGSTRMYVYGEFVNAKPTDAKVLNNKMGIASFAAGTTEVTLKMATSYISVEQAKRSLNLEIPDSQNFDATYDKAQKIWDDKLGTVEIEGATEDQLITFYSNMYRLYCYPSSYSENTGTNRVPDMKYASPYKNGQVTSGQLYVNNGFWDTYHTTWAAYALLTPEADTKLLNGIVQHYNDNGWVPRWIAPGGANSMVGTSSDVVFGDAAVKGIDFDIENALKSAIRNGAVLQTGNYQNGGRQGLDRSPFLGYTPTEVHEGFSWAMEGYINDYGISQLAKVVAEKDTTSAADKQYYTDTAEYFRNRSRNYINLFNFDLEWFMGRNIAGTLKTNSENFNPSGWGWGGDYTETNAWNMAFTVPQDGQGLANLYGGKEAMKDKLDALFTDDIRNTHSGGIHEMKEAREVRMGQYHHSNQPAHGIIYMYNYAGAPYQTAKYAREVMSRLYVGSNIGQGYLGDEDNGEMSGWYVLSSLGLFTVNMGSGEYAIGSPLFKKATINMDNGKKLVINAPENSTENIYIQSMKLNGKAFNKCFIDHADIANGGTIDFVMGSEPSAWGTDSTALPRSITRDDEIAKPAKDVTKGLTITALTVSGDYEQLAGPTNFKNLFDDYSASSSRVTLSDNLNNVVTYFNPTGKALSGYTITSGGTASNVPNGYKLEASNDGTAWVELDKRENVQFEWAVYTRAFWIAAEKQAVYKYYRLSISGAGQISEIELLGTDELFTEGSPAFIPELIAEIAALSDVTSLDQTEDIAKTQAARAKLDNLDAADKALITNIARLEAVEKQIADLIIRGDLDGNGDVNLADIVMLRNWIMEGAPSADRIAKGDLDGNGSINLSDIVTLRNIIMGVVE